MENTLSTIEYCVFPDTCLSNPMFYITYGVSPLLILCGIYFTYEMIRDYIKGKNEKIG